MEWRFCKIKTICMHQDSNPQPSDSYLLSRVLPFLRDFASILNTFVLWLTNTLVDPAKVTKTTIAAHGSITKSLYIQ